MAKGFKSGGRNFPKGNPGRPLGSRNRIPGGVKRSLLDQLKRLEEEKSEEVAELLDRLLIKGGREAITLLELALAYGYGKPVQRVQVHKPQAILLIMGHGICPHCKKMVRPEDVHEEEFQEEAEVLQARMRAIPAGEERLDAEDDA